MSLSVGIAIVGSTSFTYANANVNTFPTISHSPVHVHSTTAASGAASPSTQHIVSQFSQSTAVHPISNAAHSALVAPTTVHDLNLGSAKTLFAPNTLANFSALTIDVGGKSMTVPMQGKLLTASELLAVDQVLSGQKQTITVNAGGVATGGVFDLSKSALTELDGALAGSLGSLYVPTGVKIVDSVSNLALTGNLVNHGSILAAADTAKSVDTISASNILNGKNASISSFTAGTGGLSAAGIELDANGKLVNSGLINSTSTLAIASPVVVNHGTVSAQQLVSLQSSNVTNTGLVKSAHGDLDIDSPNSINVVGTGGTIQAAQGDINFRDASYAGSGNITLSGGNYLSNSVNLNSGTGAVNANLGNVTGVVNTNANTAHIGAATADLKLGDMNVAGDPTYFNTAGNVSIDGGIAASNGDPIAIVASGNIIGAGGTLDTSSTSGNGGALTLIAGANFSVDSGLTTNPSLGDKSSTLTITGGNATGGYIDLAGVFGEIGASPVTAVTTSSTTGQAGNITMVAYAGTAANSGSIVMPAHSGTATNALINAAGATAAQNGDVTIIGNGPNPNGAILLGDVTGHNVSVYGGTPTTTGNLTIVNGAITSGNFVAPTAIPNDTLTNTYVLTGNINASNSVIVESQGQVTTGNITSPSGTVELLSVRSEVDTGNITVAGAGGAAGAAGQNGGFVGITAGTGIFAGKIDASGGGGGGGNGTGSNQNGGAGGTGGLIILAANGDNVQVGTLNVSGGGGGGGGGATATVAAGTGGAGGTGGAITISTPYSIISEGAMLAFNGGAGGAGSSAIVIDSNNSIGGAGGGGGGAFGGGGGGGAAGISTSSSTSVAYVANGGGGGAGVFGGGGGAAADNLGTTSSGGAGGSSFAAGSGGAGEFAGASGSSIPSSQEGGAGGSSDSSGVLTVAAGGFVNTGGQGGQSGIPTIGAVTGTVSTTATSGGSATTNNGSGQVQIQFGATSYAGTPTVKIPIEIDAETLSIKGTTNTASININTNTDYTNVTQATLGGSGTLQMNAYGNLVFTGPVSVGSVILDNESPGSITSVSTINAFNGTLNADRGSISVSTAFDTLALSGSGQAISVNNFNPFNHPLVVSGTNLLSLNLTTDGPLVEVAGKTLSGASLFLDSNGNIGTAAAPFVTSATQNLTLQLGQGVAAYIKDTSTGTLNFSAAQGATATNQTVSLTSAAKSLDVGNVVADNVTLKDTNAAGSITINPQHASDVQIGDGNGAITITSVGNINFDNPPARTDGILGNSINLVSTNGSVGAASGTLSSNYVQINGNGQAGTITGGGKNGFYVLYDGDLTAHNITGSTISLVTLMGTGGQLTVSGPIGNSLTTQIYLVGDTGINTTNTTSTITGKNVQLSLQTGGDIGSAALPMVTAAGSLNLFGSQSGFYVGGSVADIRQVGSVSLGTVGAENVSITSTGVLTGANGGEIFAAQNLSLYGATGLNIMANDLVESASGSFGVGSGSLTFNGILNDTTATTFSSALGSLQVLGTTASVTNLGASLDLTAKGNITVLATDLLGVAMLPLTTNTSAFENLTIHAGGIYTSPFTSYAVALDPNSNGGNISITASSLAFAKGVIVPPQIVLNADGGMNGNAGSVVVNITGSSPVAVTTDAVAKGTTVFQIFAAADSQSTSANAGTISVSAAGSLTVTQSGFNASGVEGNGQNLAFSSLRDLSLNVDFGADTTATSSSANNGNVSLSSGALAPFLIGNGASVPVNGSNTAVIGANVTIHDLLGITNNLGISAAGTLSTPGQLTLQTANLQNNSSMTVGSSGQLQIINPSGSLAISTNAGGGYSGAQSVDLEAQKGNLTLNNFFTAANNEASTSIGAITLVATGGKVIFPTGANAQTSLTVGNDVYGNGGTIVVSASSLSFATGTAMAPSVFSFNAESTGTGGSISVTTVSPLTVGSANGNISIDVQGGGSAGSVVLKSTGALTVDGDAVIFGNSVAAGTGTFSATGSTLALSNVAPIVSGMLNNLTLISSSAAALTLGNATTNGIKDNIASTALTANNIDIENNLGTIANDPKGAVAIEAAIILTMRALSTIAPFTIEANALNASSKVGSLTFSQTGSSLLANVSISTGAAQSVTLNVGSGGLDGGSITTGKLNLTVNAGGLFLNTTATTIEGSSVGSIDFQDSSKSTVTLAGFNTNGGSFDLNTNGAVSVTGAITAGGSLILAGGGAISVSAPITVSPMSGVSSATLTSGGAAGSVTFNKTGALTVSGAGSFADLTSSGTGAFSSAASANNVTADTINISGGTTTPTTVLQTSASTFSFQGGGLNILNNFDGNVTVGALIPVVSLKFDNVAPTAASTSILTVDSIEATKGNISVISNTSSLDIAANARIATQAGSITVQNLDTAGSINFGDGAIVSAYSPTASAGSVTITVGPVTVPKLAFNYASTPAGLSVSQVSGGVAYLGGKTAGAVLTVNGTGNQLIAQGAALTLNAGASAAGITLGNNDQIIADPPVLQTSEIVSALPITVSTNVAMERNAAPDTITFGKLTYVDSIASNGAFNAGALSVTGVSSSTAVVPGSINFNILNAGLMNASLVGTTLNAPVTAGSASSNGALCAVSDTNAQAGISSFGQNSSANRTLVGRASNATSVLGKGATLIDAVEPRLIETEFGNIAIAKNALVLLAAFDGGIAIYNLHESGRNSVSLTHGNNKMSVACGQHLVLTNNHVRCFEDTNIAPHVAYRRVVGRELGDGVKCFFSEFNILSMISGIDPLRNLVSASDGEARKTGQKILKTAALLTQMSGSSIPYELMTAGAMTANARQ